MKKNATEWLTVYLHAIKYALQNSGKFIPWRVVIISTDGRIVD